MFVYNTIFKKNKFYKLLLINEFNLDPLFNVFLVNFVVNGISV